MQSFLNKNTKNLNASEILHIFQHTKFFNNNNKSNHLYIIDLLDKFGIKNKNFFFSKNSGVFNYYNKNEILSIKFFGSFSNIFFLENYFLTNKLQKSTNIKLPTSEFNNKNSNLIFSYKKLY